MYTCIIAFSHPFSVSVLARLSSSLLPGPYITQRDTLSLPAQHTVGLAYHKAHAKSFRLVVQDFGGIGAGRGLDSGRMKSMAGLIGVQILT